MKQLALAAILLLWGCSSAQHSELPESPDQQEVQNVHTSDHLNQTSELKVTIETQLMVGLWLHLGREQDRLQELLCNAPEEEKPTIQEYLVLLEEQRQQTWLSIFSVKQQ